LTFTKRNKGKTNNIKFLKSVAKKRRRKRHETLIQNRLTEAEEKQLTLGHIEGMDRIKIT
jgi:hypothetical protein